MGNWSFYLKKKKNENMDKIRPLFILYTYDLRSKLVDK